MESARQTRTLIGSVFDIRDDQLRERIRRRARTYAGSLRALGIADGTDAEALASCYPLHPLVALVLPELCSRYGQHERTLFSFLAGADPASAASFLAAKSLSARGPLPSVSLDLVYDYFVGGGAMSSLALAQSSRWTEIATRLRDIHGLSRRQTRLAKSIALLNLVSTSGTIRASREVLALAMPKAEGDLAELEARGSSPTGRSRTNTGSGRAPILTSAVSWIGRTSGCSRTLYSRSCPGWRRRPGGSGATQRGEPRAAGLLAAVRRGAGNP